MSEQDAFKMFEAIFNEEPKPRNTYNLRLDESNPVNSNIKIDDILINIFLHGMKTLYGETTNLTNITKDQFQNLNKYMYSLGYHTNLDYEYDENNFPINAKIWFAQLITDTF